MTFQDEVYTTRAYFLHYDDVEFCRQLFNFLFDFVDQQRKSAEAFSLLNGCLQEIKLIFHIELGHFELVQRVL